MKITYWKHSGFSVEGADAALLIDYIGGGFARGEKPLAALVSHSHADHRSEAAISIADETVENMVPGETRRVFGAVVRAFGSTDEGVSFLIDIEGKRVFHAGDLNFWHWKDESTAVEVEKARADYLAVLETLRPYSGTLDAAMFPVDGRLGADCAEGAELFSALMKPKIMIPMHFWNDPSPALDYAARRENTRALTRPGEFIEI